MQIKDPQSLLDSLDQERLKTYLGFNPFMEDVSASAGSIEYVEPGGKDAEGSSHTEMRTDTTKQDGIADLAAEKPSHRLIEGKVLRLGDFIDTDAVSRPS